MNLKQEPDGKMRIYELGLIVRDEGDIGSMLLAAESWDKAVEVAESNGQQVDGDNATVYELGSEEAAFAAKCYDVTVAGLLVGVCMTKAKGE